MEPLTEANLDKLLQLRKEIGRPITRDYVQWRYLRRGGGEMLLGLADGRVVAHCDSFVREYLVAGEVAQVRETAEWYCHPDYRGQGIGRDLRSEFMSRGEPLITIGGSATTKRILPQVGYRHLTDAQYFTMPLTTNAKVHRVLHGGRLPGGKLLRAVSSRVGWRWMPPVAERPPGGEARKVGEASEQPKRLRDPEGSGFITSLSGWEAKWHAEAPLEVGRFFWLRFDVDGETVGWAGCRVHRFMHANVAKIIHLEASDAATYRWMISETSAEAARQGADLVSCLCVSGPVADDLDRLGFRRERPAPVFVYDPLARDLSGAWHLSYLCGDHALLSTMY